MKKKILKISIPLLLIFTILYIGFVEYNKVVSLSNNPLSTIPTNASIIIEINNIDQAIEYIVKIFAFDFSSNLVQLCADKGPTNLIISLFSIFLLYITYMLPSDLSFKKISSHLIFNIILIIIITLIGVNGKTEFIYFQF